MQTVLAVVVAVGGWAVSPDVDDEPQLRRHPRPPAAAPEHTGPAKGQLPRPLPGANYGSGSGTMSAWVAAPHGRSWFDEFAAADVWQYGDSIARNDAEDLAARLTGHGVTVALDNWASRPTYPAATALRNDVARHGPPPVVIMATGTNDIYAPAGMTAQIDRVMTAVPRETEVVWVNVYAARSDATPPVRAADLANSRLINAQLAAAQSRWVNLHVVHWHEFLAAYPLYRPGAYLRDGMHTSTLGRAARNTLIVAAVDDALHR